jgi:hypothetical protein
MPKHVSQTQQILKPANYGTFTAEMAAGLRWLIQLLEETERRNRLPHGHFDLSVQERLRKAS